MNTLSYIEDLLTSLKNKNTLAIQAGRSKSYTEDLLELILLNDGNITRDQVLSILKLKIGDTFRGGIITHLTQTDLNIYGYLMNPAILSYGMEWSNIIDADIMYDPFFDQDAIGSGYTNTGMMILQAGATSGIAFECTYRGAFVPSRFELMTAAAAGLLEDGIYWTSSQYSPSQARTVEISGDIITEGYANKSDQNIRSVCFVTFGVTEVTELQGINTGDETLKSLATTLTGGNNEVIAIEDLDMIPIINGDTMAAPNLKMLYITYVHLKALLTAIFGKTALGLNNCDNTSDENKPVSTLQAAAIAQKTDKLLTFVNVVNNATLALGNAFKTMLINKATAVTITVPLFASIAIPINTQIDFIQTGAGKVTFAPEGATIINSKGALKSISAQYSAATLIKTDTNTWLLIGDLIA